MINIKNEYIDDKGIKYNLRNVNLETKDDLLKIGKFITETKRDSKYFDNLNSGIFLFRSNLDDGRAFRVYKDFADYKYIYHNDAKLVEKLQSLQNNVKLTDFPIGVVTIENDVIGQEIILYDGYKTLHEYIKELKDIKNIVNIYLQMIDIFKEFVNNEILYTDIHLKNFMIKDNVLKLIDFESNFMSFKISENNYKNLLILIKNNIDNINKVLNFNMNLESDTLDELKDEIQVKYKKLI